jgi:putative sterol carrier protein
MPTAREIIQLHMTDHYVPLLRGVRGTYRFEIDGVGKWFVSVNDGAVKIEEANREADCEIKCNESDFVDIVEGRRNLITAAMQGRVRIRGDLSLAQKFHGLIGAILEEERGAG